MREEHRSKQELINDLTGLRKQVADLKQAALERRRIEDGLRRSEEQLRLLVDASPVGLCLFSKAGEPVVANLPMAMMLGYDSAAELVRLGGDRGVFATDEGRAQFGGAGEPSGTVQEVALRTRDGASHLFSALWLADAAEDRRTLAVLGGLGSLPPRSAYPATEPTTPS